MVEKKEEVKSLAGARLQLAKLIGKVVKADKNPFHNSKYATIDRVWQSIEDAVNECGLVFSSKLVLLDGAFYLQSTLDHVASGERDSTLWPVSFAEKNPNQGAGASITYGRRYSLISLLNLTFVEEDNDGNDATQKLLSSPTPASTRAERRQEVHTYLLNTTEDLDLALKAIAKKADVRLKYNPQQRRYVAFSLTELQISNASRKLAKPVTWEEVQKIADKPLGSIDAKTAVQLWGQFCDEPKTTSQENIKTVVDDLFEGVK